MRASRLEHDRSAVTRGTFSEGAPRALTLAVLQRSKFHPEKAANKPRKLTAADFSFADGRVNRSCRINGGRRYRPSVSRRRRHRRGHAHIFRAGAL